MKIKLEFGKDQQPGTLIKNAVINDGVFYQEILQTGKKVPIHFAMVIDMGGARRSPIAANEIFENSIDFVKSNASMTCENLLSELGRKVDRFCTTYASGVPISYSMLIIDEATLHPWSHGEGTSLYLVHNGKAVKLLPTRDGMRSNSHLRSIGDHVIANRLERGDKVILCTDGLFSMLRNLDELAVIDRYDNPAFAAKHLASISMGRNVEDFVTTGVINYGRRRNKQLLWYILSGLFGIALVTILLVVLMQKPKTAQPLPEDLGVAILVSGQLHAASPVDGTLTEIESFSAINPGTHVINSESLPVDLRLKNRVSGSNATENIPGVEIHIAELSEVILTNLDYAVLTEAGSTPADLLDQTTIELLKGGVAVTNEGTRTYTILLNKTEDDEPVNFTLTPGSEPGGVIGVTRHENRVSVYCLAGTCTLVSGDISINIPGRNKAEFALDDQFKEMDYSPISNQELDRWAEITGN